MKKKNKLQKNWEFQRIINSRKQYISSSLILYYELTDGPARVGISVSKRFANAVNRNRQRRQIREILDSLNMWNIKANLIIIVRKPFLKLNFLNKKQEIYKILRKVS